MIGYRARKKAKKNGFSEPSAEERILLHVCFATKERALEEWHDRLEGNSSDAEVEEVPDLQPYHMRWLDSSDEPHEEVVLVAPKKVTSCVLEHYLNLVAGDFTLKHVRRATKEEIQAALSGGT